MVAVSLQSIASEKLAARGREQALRMVHAARASHIGSALSVMDILAVLYSDVLLFRPEEPNWAKRDRFLMSKGHAAVALYAILAESGFFAVEELARYGQDGERLMGHVSHFVPGVELSTGSLGHAMPVACGLAIGLAKEGPRVFCVVSDGELNEGSNWEAIMFAGHHRLNNLTMIVDRNRIQSLGRSEDVLDLGSLEEKFSAFGWRAVEIDGHDHDQIWAETNRRPDRRPTAIIANTVKGYGIDFMEDRLEWHYKSPNDIQLAEALRQVRG